MGRRRSSTLLLISCLALLLVRDAVGADGRPWARHTIDAGFRGADGVRLADADGDGHLDIATAWEESGVVRVYINPGPRACRARWPAVTVGSVRSPEDAVLVDLDGDGATDVLSSCEGSERTVYIHWAPRKKELYLDPESWESAAIPATRGKQMWMFALPLAIDARTGVDVVVGSKGQGATVGWLRAPESARDLAAWTFQPLYQAGWIMSLQAHDMDRDGDLDVVISDRKGDRAGVLWLENPGAAHAADEWREHRAAAGAGEAMFLARRDLDGDGRPDIACAIRRGGILWLRATGDTARPWEEHRVGIPRDCGGAKAVAVCDVDQDTRMDLVFTCEGATGMKSGVRWLAYERSPTEASWRDHEISGPEGIKFDRVEVLDLDADGDLDVITCEERANLGVFWYENPTR